MGLARRGRPARLVSFALCWLGVAIGVFARGVESASNLPMPIMLLPLLGSGFVPTESMPDGLQWFAEHQPFTPFIETLRAFLFGTPMGANGWLSLMWIVVLTLIGWLTVARALRAQDRPRLALRGGPDDDLADVDLPGLLDRELDGAGDGVRWDRDWSRASVIGSRTLDCSRGRRVDVHETRRHHRHPQSAVRPPGAALRRSPNRAFVPA